MIRKSFFIDKKIMCGNPSLRIVYSNNLEMSPDQKSKSLENYIYQILTWQNNSLRQVLKMTTTQSTMKSVVFALIFLCKLANISACQSQGIERSRRGIYIQYLIHFHFFTFIVTWIIGPVELRCTASQKKIHPLIT